MKRKKLLNLFSILCLIALIFVACKSGVDNPPVSECIPSGNVPAVVSSAHSISLDFQRGNSGGGLDPFTVIATIMENNSPKTGIIPTVVLGKGTHSGITELSGGRYSFTVTPVTSGEYPVTVSYSGVSITRTALVLPNVHTDWGQPMSVPGYVNTEGYEDGVTITPDGEYLFVQTGPVYFSSFLVFGTSRANNGCEGNRLVPDRCNHDWIDTTIGPVTAPERPGFFDGWFSGTTRLHNANSWGVGVEEAPNVTIPTMFYGFKRQADGSFKEPFYLAFDDQNDAIAGPFGLSFKMKGDGTATILFTLNDPSNPYPVDVDVDGFGGPDDVDSGMDVYATDITFGVNNTLGEFVPSGTTGTPPVRGSSFPPVPINFGNTGTEGIYGTQGNSHLYYSGDTVKSIWTDDEYDTGGAAADKGDISVYVLNSGTFPSSTDWTKVTLPTKVNSTDAAVEEIQPFFTGTRLYFTRKSDVRNPEVFYSNYSGDHTVAGYSNAANWSDPERVLEIDTYALGTIVAIGEPTIAIYNCETYLYFVYGYIRAYDADIPSGGTGLPDINMQAGFIKMR